MNFSQCLADVISCAQGSTDCIFGISNTTAFSILRTSQGQSVTSPATATGLSYTGCTTYCWSSQEQFSWSLFSQECVVWLLPYLALLSRLPFGSQRRMDNLMSVILTLGSPTLAGYSLFMTLLNQRWVDDQLSSGINYPSATVRKSVVHVLASLQQVPLRVHPGESALFESLVIHPDNDKWWITFAEELDYSHGWSVASATSIAWLVVAYLLNAVDSISNVANNIESNGQGTASGLLWLLPIVVGWLVLSPKCNYEHVRSAYDKANREAFVADSHDPHAAPTLVSSHFGLTIGPSSDKLCACDITSPDELRIPPVFNYARTFSWYRNVYLTSLFYRTAWVKSRKHIAVDGENISGNIHDVPRASRLGTRTQIVDYCQPNGRAHSAANVLWPPSLVSNMVVSSLMALQLQLGTASGAVLANWLTPTVGLGCRSLAFIIYATLSTTVWILLVLSSALGYYGHHLLHDQSAPDPEIVVHTRIPSAHSQYPQSNDRRVSAGQRGSVIPLEAPVSVSQADEGDLQLNVKSEQCMSTATKDTKHVRGRIMMRIADWLRWIGKSLAIINAIGIIANSLFQYAGVYTNCYCNSPLAQLGASAFDVISPDRSDIDLARKAWIGGFALSSVCCSLFLFSMFLVRGLSSS